MAKMVNAGECPLVLPNDPLRTVGLGEEVDVSNEMAKIPSVAELIENGNLAKLGKAD